MLYFNSSAVRENNVIKALNKFVYSPCYIIIVSMLMAFSNVFAMEFAVFYCYMAFVVYITLFAPDCFPVMPMFCCGYMLFSANNNPAANYEGNLFADRGNVIKFVIIAGITAVMLLSRLIFELVKNGEKRRIFPKLSFGFLALGITYITAGFFSDTYIPKSSLFGLLEIVCLCITYYFFAFTVDFSKLKADRVMFMFSVIGLGLFIEIIAMYLTPAALAAIAEGKFHRAMLKTGWGVYNNVGAMMAFFIPAPFYLASFGKKNLLWTFAACLFMGGTIITQSRTAAIIGCVIFAICTVFMIIYSKGKRRILNIALISFIALTGAAVLLLMRRNELTNIMFNLFNKENFFNVNGRFEIFETGFNHFKEYPVFGKGFYSGLDRTHLFSSANLPEDAFLPPRYHNTVIQLLASGGIVALIAYIYHRVQTVKLVLKDKSPFKYFLGLCILSLLLTSMFDCHFFNFGPGLTYGVMLICIEMMPSENKAL